MFNTLLTKSEAAQLLKVSLKTLEAWRRTGLDPRFVKTGHRIVYRLADLTAFVDQNCHRSNFERALVNWGVTKPRNDQEKKLAEVYFKEPSRKKRQ